MIFIDRTFPQFNSELKMKFHAVKAIIILVISQMPQFASGDQAEAKILFSETFEDGSDFMTTLLENPHVSLQKGCEGNDTNVIKVAYEGFEKGSRRVVHNNLLKTPTDSATLSFDVFFDQDFQWTRGGKLHGLGPINPITGGSERKPMGWSSRTMFKEDGKIASYLYEQDVNNKWGVGKKSEAPVFHAGKWHHVTLQTQLNDAGKANGYARVLVDGEAILLSENIEFRGSDDEETLIQRFLFSTFHGGNNSAWTPLDQEGNPTTVYAYFDNFLVVEGVEQNSI